MDSIDQAYFSMFQQNNNQEEKQQNILDTSEIIINELNQHLQFLTPLLNINQQKLFQFCIYIR